MDHSTADPSAETRETPRPSAPDPAGAQARPVRRGLPRAVQLLLLLAVAGLVAAYYLLGPSKGDKQAREPAPASAQAAFKPTDGQWAGFKVAEVTLVPFSASQETDGKIAPDDDLTTQVYSPYSGRITKLFAKAGDQVRAGDPLLAMQASEFVQAANDLVSANANDRTTRAQLALATTTEKRQHELYLAQGGALKDWQQSQSDLANAQGNFNSAEIALGAVRNRLRILGKKDAEITAMEASFDPTRFSPEAVVTAPISGTVITRQAGPGQNIVTQLNGGNSPVFTIGDLSRVWLVAMARETDAPRVHLGDAVEVRVLAFPDRVFKARITYVAAGLDPNTHRLPLHAEVENPDGLLKPEMFASFRIITSAASQAPAVPASALVYEGDGAHVWLAGPDKTLSIREVRIGRSDGGMVEVLDGLKPGDRVVTAGSLFIDRAAEAD
jgi:cobalt-zinc-cadmium efflux system membrane fusion protein